MMSATRKQFRRIETVELLFITAAMLGLLCLAEIRFLRSDKRSGEALGDVVAVQTIETPSEGF